MYGSSPFAISKGEDPQGANSIRATPVKQKANANLSVTYRASNSSAGYQEWIEIQGLSEEALTYLRASDSKKELISLRTSLDESAVSMFGRAELEGALLKFYPALTSSQEFPTMCMFPENF